MPGTVMGAQIRPVLVPACRAAAQAALRRRLPLGSAQCLQHVGAGNAVISCDLGVFTDQAAEPVPPKNPDIRAYCGRM
jgi:hypothetical protein